MTIRRKLIAAALALGAGCGDNTPLPGSTPLVSPAQTEEPDPGGGGGGGGGGDQDADGDGLTDADEAELGSDPLEADTDGDGWDDGDEVAGNTDPLLGADHPYTGGWAIGACRRDLVSTGNDVGDIAESFALTDQHGDTVRLHDFCDREVLLVGAAFW